MADAERYLSFSHIENERPVVAFCELCGKRFEAQPEAGKSVDDLILKVRAEFESHDCNSKG
jgi:hypothetical protein